MTVACALAATARRGPLKDRSPDSCSFQTLGDKTMAKRGKSLSSQHSYCWQLEAIRGVKHPPRPHLVSRQTPLGWGGAPFSASVLAECQRPKLYAFPSRLRKQPCRGFCPCIIQEAQKLETANADFPSSVGSLSQATIV